MGHGLTDRRSNLDWTDLPDLLYSPRVDTKLAPARGAVDPAIDEIALKALTCY